MTQSDVAKPWHIHLYVIAELFVEPNKNTYRADKCIVKGCGHVLITPMKGAWSA